MMMTCGRARRLLWPDTGPQEATAEIVAAREHASRCPLCQRFLDDMRRLSDRIREAGPRPEAPVEVRDRLFKAIARARTDEASRAPIRRHRAWMAALAVALLVAGTWLGLSLVPERVNPSLDPLAVIAEDHLRSQRTTGLASSDSLEVTRWLADRLPFALEIPIFPDAQLKGARLLLVNRQSGAVVDYVIGGRSLSYYVLPAVAGEATSSPREVRVTSRAGYRIAVWEDGSLTHALVAGLPGPKLVELAHYCIEQMMAIGPSTWSDQRFSLVRSLAPVLARDNQPISRSSSRTARAHFRQPRTCLSRNLVLSLSQTSQDEPEPV